jgi:hypothetical protein
MNQTRKNDSIQKIKNKQNNYKAFVRERNKQTERSPLVGEVSANFRGGRCRVVTMADS